MTDQELRDLVAGIAKAQAETDKQIKQVNKQIGELGNKFGGFAEGMALPSMDKILRQHFGMNDTQPRRKVSRNGQTIEIDFLALDQVVRKEAYIVEVKSHLDESGIDQILKTIAEAPKFIDDLKGLKIYGIIAAVDIAENARKKAIKEGLYLARISGDTFELEAPENFKPRVFNVEPKQNGRATDRSKKKKPPTK